MKPNPKGRPKLPEKKRKSIILRVCATKKQAATFERLGAAEWLRRLLDDSAEGCPVARSE